MKKKIGKKIIAAVTGALLPFLVIIIIATGLLAVVDLVASVISDAGKKIAGFFDSIGKEPIEEQIKLTDLSAYGLDEMLEIAWDEDVLTDETLQEMMIERETFVALLQEVKNANEVYDTADKTIQAKHIWTTTVEKKVYDPSKKEMVTVSEVETHEEFKDMSYPVTAETYENIGYEIPWQAVYITAVEQALQNYGANMQLMGQSGTDGEQPSGNSTGVEASAGGEDDEVSDVEDASNSTTFGPFKAGWSPASEYQKKQEAEYHDWIEEYAAMYNLPPDLIRAVITQESNWNPDASSGVAYGLAQFTKAAWLDYGIRALGYSENDVWDPEASIHACARLLSALVKEFDGDPVLALAAYNQGSSTVHGWVESGTLSNSSHWVYAAGVLTKFTGYTYTATQLAQGDYIGGERVNISVGYGTLTATGQISLTPAQVKELVQQFKTRFVYIFDVVRDPETYYDFATCQSLPNYGEKRSGDPSTEAGEYIWYEPVSSLSVAEAAFFDLNYMPLNVKTDYVIRLDRWESMIRFYWPNYVASWFKSLIELLPNGKDLPAVYDYYASIASDIVEYSGNSYSPDGSGYQYAGMASGDYRPLDCVSPSIAIPENCGGMGIPLYLQYDLRWAGISFGGGNISSSGCGATSVAMVLSYELQKCIYPSDVVAVIGNRYYVPGYGQSWSMVPAACQAFGCRAVQQTVNADAIVASLKAGHPVIVSTDGHGTTQEFTKNGHYIVLRGLTDDGLVLVNDPNDSKSKKHYEKAYTPQFIYSECCRNGSPKVMYTIYGPDE